MSDNLQQRPVVPSLLEDVYRDPWRCHGIEFLHDVDSPKTPDVLLLGIPLLRHPSDRQQLIQQLLDVLDCYGYATWVEVKAAMAIASSRKPPATNRGVKSS